jgi:hypothetical protein
MAYQIIQEEEGLSKQLAEYFNISSVWIGMYAFQEIQKGKIRK